MTDGEKRQNLNEATGEAMVEASTNESGRAAFDMYELRAKKLIAGQRAKEIAHPLILWPPSKEEQQQIELVVIAAIFAERAHCLAAVLESENRDEAVAAIKARGPAFTPPGWPHVDFEMIDEIKAERDGHGHTELHVAGGPDPDNCGEANKE